MTTFENQQKGMELMNTLFEKSWEDNSFKKQFIKNPVATVESFTGRDFEMPENKRLVIEDQTDESVIYLNIPPKPNLDELELSDEQLEQVAGGDGFAIAGAIASAICIADFCYGAYQGWNSVKQK